MKDVDTDKILEVTKFLADFALRHDLTDGEIAMYVGMALLGYNELCTLLIKKMRGALNVQG